MRNVVVAGYARSPFHLAGKGALARVRPDDLAAQVIRGLIQQTGVKAEDIEDIVLGCAFPEGEQGFNIARLIGLLADLPLSVGGMTVNRFCGSSMQAVHMAAGAIATGAGEAFVCGGVESMSRVPMGADGGPFAEDPETAINTGFVPQGIGADLIATIEGWSRDDVDEFALQSQKKAAHARDSGWFDRSVVPVRDENGLIVLERDDFIKPDTDMQKLGALKASFAMPGSMGFDAVALAKYPQVERIDHVHTPGNSSGIVDGASLVMVGNEKAGKDLGLDPRGRVVAIALTATDPTIMLTGPGPASEKALAKAGLTIDDIDLVEINEAFASVALRLQRDLNVPDEKLNVVGGAIAMGHPLGATGGCLVSTMLDELERRNQKRALICMCVGGGMGIASIIERL